MTYITAVSISERTTAAPTAKVLPTPSLETRLQAALEHARRLTQMRGIDHRDVAIAWETVAELQAAFYYRQQATLTPFAQYCADHPDAPESRIYGD